MAYQKKRMGQVKGCVKQPSGVILCYQRSLMNYIMENHKTTALAGSYRGLLSLDETGGKVAVTGNFGIGAPAAVTVMEDLIASGVAKFISVGSAGTLQKHIKPGDLMVCERAIRDEGTSHHYLKPAKYAHASKEMSARIKKALDQAGLGYFTGTSWTIDAPYRETVAEARRYQKEGVATVEMEASALFAVAQFRKAEIGAIFTVSDSLAELRWKPKFHSRKTKKGLEVLYRAAVSALLAG